MTAIVPNNEVRADGKVVIGVADMAVSADPNATLITYALGSCIGVTLFDPVRQVAGMLHFMLPSPKTSSTDPDLKPAMFATTGIPLLFKMAYDLGARKENMIVCAAGGAEILADNGHFKVGFRNRTMLRKIFWKNNILLSADDTGGTISRTLSLSVADGAISIRNKGEERSLWPM